MASRREQDRNSNQTRLPGGSKLTLAKWIVICESVALCFARPLLLAGLFVVLAWTNIFEKLYPYAHLAALVIFVTVFFDALGKAWHIYKPAPASAARRRLEEASGLKHRPLDTLNDRPAIMGEEQSTLWRAHVERSRTQLNKLRWPRFTLSFADRDPFALRYAVLIMLCVGMFCSWGVWGGRLLAAINPTLETSLGHFKPAIDAWITPPEYTGLAPIMIATPAGAQNDKDVINVPAGSTISAHIADKSGAIPQLLVNGEKVSFATDDYNDFGILVTIASGDTITIRRGWRELGKWRIRVVPDEIPHINLTEAPSVSERKNVQLAWHATDDYGIASVTAHITPRETVAGAKDETVAVDLATPQAKDVKRISFEDLTSSPWAGLSVQIQLSTTDSTGHEAKSEPVDFMLPERDFFNPLARALIEERKRLLRTPHDANARNEAANVMASIAAHHTAEFRGDPVIVMALRSGAVRLVLDRAATSIPPVIDILWQAAVRIEDGGTSMAEQRLQQAQKELADALDRDADQAEIQQLIDKLHQALAQYLAQLSMQSSNSPPMNSDLEQALGERTNSLTPKDLERMLDQMRDLSASGAQDQAREELSKLQQMLQNMRTGQPQLSKEQEQAVKSLSGLRELAKRQQKLLEETFRQAQDNKGDNNQLAVQQQDMRDNLRTLMDGTTKDDATEDLEQSGQSMEGATLNLKHDAPRGAVQQQNDALASLQKAIQSKSEELRASMFMLPRTGRGTAGKDNDPFGRSGFTRDDDRVRVPEQMEARKVREILNELQRRAGDLGRSKTERDYIERLLQNF